MCGGEGFKTYGSQGSMAPLELVEQSMKYQLRKLGLSTGKSDLSPPLPLTQAVIHGSQPIEERHILLIP